MSKSEANLIDAAVVLVLAAKKQHIDLTLLEIDAESVVMDSGVSEVKNTDTGDVKRIIRQVIEEAKKR
ncbi:hypothetical protein [Pseudomonas sp. GZD-222]|uniref:hypothetical protein n=1 Tax=Pseudomonas sp. GZD-222 TaxID=3404805 RepID=UPI003BB6A0B6